MHVKDQLDKKIQRPTIAVVQAAIAAASHTTYNPKKTLHAEQALEGLPGSIGRNRGGSNKTCEFGCNK